MAGINAIIKFVDLYKKQKLQENKFFNEATISGTENC